MLVFVDESGFSLRPSMNKTWCPAGHPAVLKAPLCREHLSMIGGLTWEGHLYTQVHRTAINAKAAIDFLRHLLLHLPGPLLLLWDGARIHRPVVGPLARGNQEAARASWLARGAHSSRRAPQLIYAGERQYVGTQGPTCAGFPSAVEVGREARCADGFQSGEELPRLD
jgi:hypothetical protein